MLNVGPDANGELPTGAVARLAEIGAWMRINDEAIYSTRPVAPYRDAKSCFTRAKDGAIYAIYLLDEGEVLPEMIELKDVLPTTGATIRLLGSDIELKWQRTGAGVRIAFPEAVRNQASGSYAVNLRISPTTPHTKQSGI